MNEAWKAIRDYEDCYLISNLGKVKRIERMGSRGKMVGGNFLNPWSLKTGHLMVCLCKNGMAINKDLGKLVYQNFIHNLEGSDTVKYLDKDNTNVCVSNIISITKSEKVRCKHPKKNGSSTYKGVCYNKRDNKYCASGKQHGLQVWIGQYDTEIEAAKAYDKFVYENIRGEYETNDSLGIYGMEGVVANQIIGVDQVKIRHPYRDLFPINKDVLFRIKESMELTGYDKSFPIILGEIGGITVLIDGHTRIRACRISNIKKIPYIKHVFKTEEEALNYAMHVQRDRRNLTDAELASVFNFYDEIRNPLDYIKRDENGGYIESDNKIGKSSKETAKKLNISEQKVKRLRSLSKPGRENALRFVKKGEKSIHQAYMDDVYSGKKGDIGYKENLFLEKITNCTTKLIPQILKTDEKIYDKWQEELSKIIIKAFKKPIVDK